VRKLIGEPEIFVAAQVFWAGRNSFKEKPSAFPLVVGPNCGQRMVSEERSPQKISQRGGLLGEKFWRRK